MGVAAYKTVELDDSLGGAAIQHRETQGNESQAFLNLFKTFGGVKYADGGVDSGFKKVNRDEYTKRLLQVKGKRNVRVIPVEISFKSLNQGDVFVLDCGLKIFQWNGKNSSKAERTKARPARVRAEGSTIGRSSQDVGASGGGTPSMPGDRASTSCATSATTSVVARPRSSSSVMSTKRPSRERSGGGGREKGLCRGLGTCAVRGHASECAAR